ncbi:MAG TPA: nitroreductase [Chitinophagales bacterium]|nr:nitroreductase [Chitinophagales bacterium]
MNISDIIKKRRTVKPEEFNGTIIHESDINELLAAANWAPTHGLTEPWRFIVFAGKEGVQQFGQIHASLYKQETSAEQFLQKKYDTILHKPDKASHLFIIVMKRGDRDNIPEIEELAATACAVQNILLVAAEKNIATYWGTGGMCYHPKMKSYFGFGEQDRIMGFLYLGYTDKTPADGFRNSSINEKTTWFNSSNF